MTLQEVRDEISRQRLLHEGTRILGELDRFQGLCTSCGYTVSLGSVRAPIYDVMERAFPPDLKPAVAA